MNALWTTANQFQTDGLKRLEEMAFRLRQDTQDTYLRACRLHQRVKQSIELYERVQEATTASRALVSFSEEQRGLREQERVLRADLKRLGAIAKGLS